MFNRWMKSDLATIECFEKREILRDSFHIYCLRERERKKSFLFDYFFFLSLAFFYTNIYYIYYMQYKFDER